ncbi:hypothetical protein M1E25_03130 [Streptomyces sp. MTZ3.1]|uniref:Uncharacterized protein n=1 Tax=Streptomyces meridianus TaxID=2938945 RepID=A0ABT0X1C3_9ACTN|nr:hypothetical protein [Streptomyces meridianus]MCM2576357.1 hypothetical protein [Streptomyces meridianus]
MVSPSIGWSGEELAAHVAEGFGPLVVLLGQDRADQGYVNVWTSGWHERSTWEAFVRARSDVLKRCGRGFELLT